MYQYVSIWSLYQFVSVWTYFLGERHERFCWQMLTSSKIGTEGSQHDNPHFPGRLRSGFDLVWSHDLRLSDAPAARCVCQGVSTISVCLCTLAWSASHLLKSLNLPASWSLVNDKNIQPNYTDCAARLISSSSRFNQMTSTLSPSPLDPSWTKDCGKRAPSLKSVNGQDLS